MRALLIVCLLTPALALAQETEPPAPEPSPALAELAVALGDVAITAHDARVLPPDVPNGVVPLATTEDGFVLHVSVSDGNALDYAVTDPLGRFVPVMTHTTGDGEAASCWIAAEAAPGNAHAWQVTCPYAM